MGVDFRRRHRLDGAFWWSFAALAWVLVGVGFGDAIRLRFTGQAEYPAPAALVIHVWTFFAWLSLLVLQITLAASGHMRLHRLVGLAGMLLVPVMAWSAIAAELHGQQFRAATDPDAIRFLPIPVASILCFTGCAAAALLLRRRPDWHKRMIYLATSTVLVATFFRWWGDALYAALPPGRVAEWTANYIGVALLLALGAGYDVATRGRLHSAWKIAIPLLLALQFTAVAIGQGAWWPDVGRRLLGIA